ncbi:MAG: thiosulfate sulfurtransferase GlpE [Pseudomonadales bacterium]|nr:thiosulfate sulfurtransferase GlpE [Pseudomonadales bacterium]
MDVNFKRISVDEAQQLIAEHPSKVQIVDIRDDESFENGHIESAFHLHNSNLQDFIAGADPEQPLLVYCYHGHMSQGAAAFLAEQGFGETYSLDGGYEAWSELESSA